MAESSSKQSKDEQQYEVLDCGKPVNFTYYEDLMGIIHRKKHKISPEPDVLFTLHVHDEGQEREDEEEL